MKLVKAKDGSTNEELYINLTAIMSIKNTFKCTKDINKAFYIRLQDLNYGYYLSVEDGLRIINSCTLIAKVS